MRYLGQTTFSQDVVVRDARTGAFIKGATVWLRVKGQRPLKEAVTDANGFARFSNVPVPSMENLVFDAVAPGYARSEPVAATGGEAAVIEMTTPMTLADVLSYVLVGGIVILFGTSLVMRR